MIETVVLIVLVCVALALVGLVLIQQGKGADAGASFGGGASQTVFGGAGSGNFLTKTTWTLGIIFFICCLVLAYFARQHAESAGRFDFSEKPVIEQSAPSASDVPQLPSGNAAAQPAQSEAASGAASVPSAPAETASAASEAPVVPATPD